MRDRSPLFFAFFVLLVGCGATPGAVDPGADTDPIAQPEDSGVTPGSDAAPGVDSAVVDSAVGPDAIADAPVTRACSPTDPRTTPVIVSVLPDEGEKPYVDVLAAAKSDIRVFGYMMGYGAILDTLVAQAKAGLDVRVILDGVNERTVNEKYKTALEAAGAKVQWSDPKFSYMHAKSIVVDGRVGVVSTGNYSKSFIEKERNFVARLDEAQDVADLAALFDADWMGVAPDLSCTRLLVAPVNARDRLVALVSSAKKSIVIESMQYADTAVVAAVSARKAAGVDVRVLLAAPSWITANSDAGAALVKQGIPARWLSSPTVHVKAMVIDGERAYLGSENLSYTSLSKNREVGVIVSDVPAVTMMSATFETDWSHATSF
jgi:cardiolipin synthase